MVFLLPRIAIDALQAITVLLPVVNRVECFAKQSLYESELVFENVFQELVVSTIEIVKHPCVEHLQLLDALLGLFLVALAELLKVKGQHVLLVELELNHFLRL